MKNKNLMILGTAIIGAVVTGTCIIVDKLNKIQETLDDVNSGLEVLYGVQNGYIIDSYSMNDVKEPEPEEENVTVTKSSLDNKHEAPENNSTVDYASMFAKDKPVIPEPKTFAHVITEDEFGDIDEYSISDLTYYSDGYLVTVDDRIIDPDDFVGDALELFETADEDEDTIYVRNDYKRAYYEISRVLDKYYE